MTLEAVAICPIDPQGRWYGPEAQACPVCGTGMEIFVRSRPVERDDEGMATSADPMPGWLMLWVGGVVVACAAAIIYILLAT